MLRTKIFTGIVFFFAIISACTKKAMPDSGNKENSNTEKTSTAKTTETKSVATNPSNEKTGMTETGVKTTPQTETKPTPSGPQKPSLEEMGASIYTTKCTRCHASKDPAAYTWSQWGGILKKMIPNAKLTNDEEEYVRAYIKANSK